jgi:hypothetical protein
VAAALLLIALNAVSGWRSADAANAFPQTLAELPPPEPPGGFMTVTASALRLNRIKWEPGDVTYVSADHVSTGPDVVSVHPIDFSTWAAVALGSDGHCYAVLSYQPIGEGQDYYGQLSRHTPCRGSEATRANVNQSNPPG